MAADHETMPEPPLPTRTLRLTCNHWNPGPVPKAPFYLRTARGRTYRVHEVKACRPGSRALARLACTRQRPEDMPADAAVHPWQWASRG